jgi:ArsR family transcriptional regulator
MILTAESCSPPVSDLTETGTTRSLCGPSGDFAAASKLAVVAHGFAHTARVDIVRRLAERGPMVAGGIVAESDLAQSTVSEHLRVLRDAGIVVSEQVGSRVWYRLGPANVIGVLRALGDVANQRGIEVS